MTPFDCPACGHPLYSRKSGSCSVCGEPVSAELALTPQQREALAAEVEDSKRRAARYMGWGGGAGGDGGGWAGGCGGGGDGGGGDGGGGC